MYFGSLSCVRRRACWWPWHAELSTWLCMPRPPAGTFHTEDAGQEPGIERKHMQRVQHAPVGFCRGHHLVDKQHAGRQLGRERECGAHVAHAVAQPLAGDAAGVDRQERRAALGRRRARQQCLARACAGFRNEGFGRAASCYCTGKDDHALRTHLRHAQRVWGAPGKAVAFGRGLR